MTKTSETQVSLTATNWVGLIGIALTVVAAVVHQASRLSVVETQVEMILRHIEKGS